MFYQSLTMGRSRGVALLLGESFGVEDGVARPEPDRDAATRDDLIAALRFPLAPGWILQGSGRRKTLPHGRG